MQNYCGIDLDATCRRIACFIRVSRYSDKQLASILRTSVQSVNKWRHAHNLPDIDNMFVLSRVLGISLDDLIISCDRREKKLQSDVRDRAAVYTSFLGVIFAASHSDDAHKYAIKASLRDHGIDYTKDGIQLCF